MYVKSSNNSKLFFYFLEALKLVTKTFHGNQSKLAHLVGKAPSAFSGLLNGVSCSPLVMESIASKLNVDILDFLAAGRLLRGDCRMEEQSFLRVCQVLDPVLFSDHNLICIKESILDTPEAQKAQKIFACFTGIGDNGSIKDAVDFVRMTYSLDKLPLSKISTENKPFTQPFPSWLTPYFSELLQYDKIEQNIVLNIIKFIQGKKNLN